MITEEALDEMYGRAMRDMYGAMGTDVLDLVIVVRKMKEHSVTLNTVSYRIAEAIGKVTRPEPIDSDVEGDLEVLIAERDRLRHGVNHPYGGIDGCNQCAVDSGMCSCGDEHREVNGDCLLHKHRLSPTATHCVLCGEDWGA